MDLVRACEYLDSIRVPLSIALVGLCLIWGRVVSRRVG